MGGVPVAYAWVHSWFPIVKQKLPQEFPYNGLGFHAEDPYPERPKYAKAKHVGLLRLEPHLLFWVDTGDLSYWCTRVDTGYQHDTSHVSLVQRLPQVWEEPLAGSWPDP